MSRSSIADRREENTRRALLTRGEEEEDLAVRHGVDEIERDLQQGARMSAVADGGQGRVRVRAHLGQDKVEAPLGRGRD